MSAISVTCRCGQVKAELAEPPSGDRNRCVCYCRSCQRFAEELGQADTVLDANGGTDIFQTAPSHFRLTAGREHIACLQFTPNGPLRWYAACCMSPLANTPSKAGLPFVSLIVPTLTHGNDPDRLEALTGPVKQRIYARHAKGDRAALDAADGLPLSLLLTALGAIVKYRLRGEHHRTAFFDGEPPVPIADVDRRYGSESA